MKIYLVLFFLTGTLALFGQNQSKTGITKVITEDYFDRTGTLFVKLFKKIGSDSTYWETWNTDDKNAIIYTGIIGQLGEYVYITAGNLEDLKDSINPIIHEKLKDNFRKISLKKYYTLDIVFKLIAWGKEEDIMKFEVHRKVINDILLKTGNGDCDDSEIGSGELIYFAEVINPYHAIKSIASALRDNQLNDKYYFTISKGAHIIAKKIVPPTE
jgi:hypothetical protein